AVAEYRLEERWKEMSLIRRAAHISWKPHMTLTQKAIYKLGRDQQLNKYEGQRSGAIKAGTNHQKAVRVAEAALKQANEMVEAQLRAIRPAAEAELQKRQIIAQDARQHTQKSSTLIPARTLTPRP